MSGKSDELRSGIRKRGTGPSVCPVVSGVNDGQPHGKFESLSRAVDTGGYVAAAVAAIGSNEA